MGPPAWRGGRNEPIGCWKARRQPLARRGQRQDGSGDTSDRDIAFRVSRSLDRARSLST